MRRTRSPSGSATRRTTPSASASSSPTRRSTAFEAADPPTFARDHAQLRPLVGHRHPLPRRPCERSGGHGFSALSRRHLLNILQARAAELGVDVRFHTEAPPVAELAASHDLVIAADGINSVVRDALAEHFGPTLDRRQCKFMWLGTDLVFEAFTFHIVETEYGVFQIHGYPYDETMRTFIVETDEATWRRAGLDAREAHPFAPGENDEESIAFCRELFADILGDHTLVANNSRWLNFNTVRNEHWHARQRRAARRRGAHRALLDRLGHEARDGGRHRARVGVPRPATTSGARSTAYEDERRPVVESTQRAAQASLEWFEGIARYVGQEPSEFAFNLLTRSRRITYDNLRVRDPGFVASVDDDFTAVRAGLERPRADPADVPAVPPARARAAQPRRRLADGHVLRGRRRRRATSTSSTSARAAVGGAGARDDGDDLHVGGGPDHAGLRRAVPRRPRRGLAADRRLRPHPRHGAHRRADRPQRAQGLHEAHVGGDGRAARGRRLAACSPRRRCPTSTTARCRAR